MTSSCRNAIAYYVPEISVVRLIFEAVLNRSSKMTRTRRWSPIFLLSSDWTDSCTAMMMVIIIFSIIQFIRICNKKCNRNDMVTWTRVHFTNDFFIVIQIQWNFNCAVIPVVLKLSLWNFAHDRTAVLSRQVKTFVAIDTLHWSYTTTKFLSYLKYVEKIDREMRWDDLIIWKRFCIAGPLWGESAGDRWIYLTTWQQCWQHFNAMASFSTIMSQLICN